VQTSNVIGVIVEGETGYYKTDLMDSNYIKTHDDAKAFVEGFNSAIGLTKGEVKAMEFGSMFGWDVPGAQPKSWNDDGTPIKAGY
jgi:hypothetical protein